MGQRGLLRRGSRYYFRVRIPADLRAIFDRTREYKVSLQTSDASVARLRAMEEALRAERYFEGARRQDLGYVPRAQVWRLDPDRIRARTAFRAGSRVDLHSIDDAFIDGFCCTYLRSSLDEDADRRANPAIGGRMYVELNEELRRGDLEELRSMLGTGELEALRHRLEFFLDDLGYRLVGEPEGYRRLLVRFAEVLIREHEVLDGRAKGQVFDAEVIAPLSRCLGRAAGKTKLDLRMKDLLEHWKIGKKRTSKTIAEYESIAREFESFIGEKLKVSRLSLLTKSDVVAFRDHLFGDGLNYKTVRKKIGALKTLFNKAVNDSKIESNPCQGVSVPSAEAEDKPREIFSGEDLRTIYSARIYSEGFRPAGCGIDAAVWVPVIGLFTGMRLEEICQLRVADLEQDDELGYYIRIDDEDGKRLKTIWARRNVPVHAELIRLGLVEFFLGKRSRGERLMFPDLGLDKYGRQSSRCTKKWNEELHKTLSAPRGNSSLTFHSFRHTFKHICRDCHIPEDVHDALTGHKGDNSKTVSRGYGHKYYPRGPLFEAIRRYVVRGLDLSHLKLPSAS